MPVNSNTPSPHHLHLHSPLPLSPTLCATTQSASPSLHNQVVSASAIQASTTTSLAMMMTLPCHVRSVVQLRQHLPPLHPPQAEESFSCAAHFLVPSKPLEEMPPTATTSTPTPTPSSFAQHQWPTSQHFERSCEDHTCRWHNFSFKAI